MLASFSGVDLSHTGNWNDYLNRIEIVDSLALLTWNHLQSDPDYAGKPYMFITADHGRHDDAHGGFQNHGDTCPGWQHIIFMALGPNVRAGYDATTAYTQRNVCRTAGTILGVSTPNASGAVMQDIFEQPSTGVLH